MGLISPFGGCSNWGREHLQHWHGPDLQWQEGQVRARHSCLVMLTLSLPRRLTMLGLMQSCAKTFPPGVELSEGLVWVRMVQCCKKGDSSDCPWLYPTNIFLLLPATDLCGEKPNWGNPRKFGFLGICAPGERPCGWWLVMGEVEMQPFSSLTGRLTLFCSLVCSKLN